MSVSYNMKARLSFAAQILRYCSCVTCAKHLQVQANQRLDSTERTHRSTLSKTTCKLLGQTPASPCLLTHDDSHTCSHTSGVRSQALPHFHLITVLTVEAPTYEWKVPTAQAPQRPQRPGTACPGCPALELQRQCLTPSLGCPSGCPGPALGYPCCCCYLKHPLLGVGPAAPAAAPAPGPQALGQHLHCCQWRASPASHCYCCCRSPLPCAALSQMQRQHQ